MYYAVTIATLVTMALALARALMGPTVYDRVLAVNMFGTKTVLLLAVVAFLYGRPDFLDLALAYGVAHEWEQKGKKVSVRQRIALTQAARRAKETLLGADAPEPRHRRSRQRLAPHDVRPLGLRR